MISVCMATYNGEKYIKEQLDSILKQISDSDEIIISDDGSTDNTVEIIKLYQESNRNIKLVEGPRKGLIKNFENALNLSRGEIIFLSDQDDIWVEGKVERVMKEFEKTAVSLILHDAYIVDSEGKIIESSFYKHRGSKPGLISNIVKNSYLGCCMAFKRELLNECLPFPAKIEMHDWWIGLMGEKFGKVTFIHKQYLMYRRHGDNVSSFHHHPIRKMIYNRAYLIYQLQLRVKRNKGKC